MALIFFVLGKFFVSNFSVYLLTAVIKAATVAKRHYVSENAILVTNIYSN